MGRGILASLFHRLYLARKFCMIYVILKAKILSNLLELTKYHIPFSED